MAYNLVAWSAHWKLFTLKTRQYLDRGNKDDEISGDSPGQESRSVMRPGHPVIITAQEAAAASWPCSPVTLSIEQRSGPGPIPGFHHFNTIFVSCHVLVSSRTEFSWSLWMTSADVCWSGDELLSHCLRWEMSVLHDAWCLLHAAVTCVLVLQSAVCYQPINGQCKDRTSSQLSGVRPRGH